MNISVLFCCPQVNGVNVVKVGHKQVVSLIRQGGSRLLMKVVSVTRKPESEEVVRKKGKDGKHGIYSSVSCFLKELHAIIYMLV